MQIEQLTVNGIPVINLKGELNLPNNDNVKKILQTYLDKNIIKVIINCKELSFLDSTGIGLIVDFSNKLQKSGGMLVICNLNSEIENLLNIANLLDILINFKNQEQALEYLQQN